MGLLSVYESMTGDQGLDKTASAPAPVDERVQVLEKYAGLADQLLSEEYGNDYGREDVVKLASLLIQHDEEVTEQQEKVAELVEGGIVFARSFNQELIRLNS
jgi:hypothetical protein